MSIKNCIFYLLLLFSIGSYAQVSINEICTINDDALTDEDGDKSDWLELYNSGSLQNMANYSLHSSNSNLLFTFPNINLPSNSYLIVFLSGKNKSAAQLHTNFKLVGNDIISLLNPNGNPVSSIYPPNLKVDDAYGAYPNGTANYEVLTTATPGSSNAASNHYPAYTQAPQFSAAAGFYNQSQIVILSNSDPSSTIYYTLNGSEPSTNSIAYTAPIEINKTTVVKAFSKSALLPKSKIICNTYFINEQVNLPVMSISTDSLLLWDSISGLLSLGLNADSLPPYYGANFWADTQLKVYLQYFDKNKNLQLNQYSGLEIHGGSMNRSQPMKSFRMLSKKKYEKDHFNYPLIPDKPIQAYRKFVLRNASSDFLKTNFREGLIHKVVIANTFLDANGYEPCVVYLNGYYYGIHNIREKIDDYYLEENHGADRKNIDMLTDNNVAEEGDWLAFDSVYNFVTAHNMHLQSNFNEAAERIDLKNLSDYFITETYFDNNDWPEGNVRVWRERKPGSKFRYILFDVDASLGTFPWSPSSLNMLSKCLHLYVDSIPNKHCIILKNLLQNETYKEYFITRYADLFNTAYSTSCFLETMDSVKHKIAQDIPRFYTQWGSNFGAWEYEINELLIPYIINRNKLSKTDVLNEFGLPNYYELGITCSPTEAFSELRLNTVVWRKPQFVGTYYETVPVRFKIQPKAGYIFSHWQLSNGQILLSDSITLAMTESLSATAYYYPENQLADAFLFPNPSNNGSVFIRTNFLQNTSSTIEIVNHLGQVVNRQSKILPIDQHTLEIKTDYLSAGMYVVKLSSETGSTSVKMVIN